MTTANHPGGTPRRGGRIWRLQLGSLFAAAVLNLAGCQPRTAPSPPAEVRQWQEELVVVREVSGDYETVWDDLLDALNNRGLTVSSVSHVQRMLARTGKALGAKKEIYARAKVLEFCSAALSRQMLEANPHYLAFCPFQIMIYALPQEPERIYLAYRRPRWRPGPPDATLAAVERLVQGIIAEVAANQEMYQ